MSGKLHLTLACGDYELTRALIEGTVRPDGIELTVVTDMTAEERHWRMIRKREFDVAELSMSNYLIAKSLRMPFVAIPVFPHRRFRHGFIYVNAGKGIQKPTDLIGKKVGLQNFQATSNLWVRGILEHEFDVPHREIRWFKQEDETVDSAPPKHLDLQKIPPGKSVETLLVEGELDAVMHPDIIKPVAERDGRVRRLFENYKELEVEYYRRTGIFPIMHTTAIRQDIVERYPWVPANLTQAFERAKEIAYKKMENPRRIPLAWFSHAREEQEEILGRDPWAYGLGEANRKNLETLSRYSFEQGLIERRLAIDELFLGA